MSVGRVEPGAETWPGRCLQSHGCEPAAVACRAGPDHLLASLPGVGTAEQGSIGGFLSK